MKKGFYPRLALEGMRKNRQLYLPYLITCMGMVMMTYILSFLETCPAINALPGSENIQTLMHLGVYILVFFAGIFLFYTNSFLMRRRKHEFGLYHILGMNKRNIARILFWEMVFTSLHTLIGGLFFGIVFSKLAELGFANILHAKIDYSLSLCAESFRTVIVPFCMIFLLLYLNGLRQLYFSKTISLLQSESVGEKPPKANFLLGILGFFLLGIAYYLAVSSKDPVSSMGIFFLAVLLVIAGTYLVMIAGSVLLCRLLQKNKRYYYHPGHFVSVSSMTYRMKRNGAGLASICILATMVLVMLSSTSALFAGEEQILRDRYPREMNLNLYFSDLDAMSVAHQNALTECADTVLKTYHITAENTLRVGAVSLAAQLNDGDVIYDKKQISDLYIGTATDTGEFYIISLEDYNASTGENETLSPGEILFYCSNKNYHRETFGFQNGKRYTIKRYLESSLIGSAISLSVVPTYLIVTPDLADMTAPLTDAEGNFAASCRFYYCFDTTGGTCDDAALAGALRDALSPLKTTCGFSTVFSDSRDVQRGYFWALYGGIFYLGILLSIVFIFSAILIIYYKQISEGYEDQARFAILQKVGMTHREIKRSINSQLLVVFFLPLIGAGLHLVFAFPIIEKLLMLFSLANRPLFIRTSLASYLLYAVCYLVVYRITSNAYYHIVSTADREI